MKVRRYVVAQRTQKIKSFFKQYERYLSGGAFIAGFIGDSLILPRIDFWGVYALLGVYLFFVMTAIALTLALEVAHPIKKYFTTIAPALPLVTQFFFGSLMSAIFVYYSRSATIVESWPFMMLLIIIFAGNEIFQSKLKRLEFQVSLLFFVIYMGMVFAVPVFFGAIGPYMFLLSGVVALIVAVLYILLLRIFSPKTIARAKWFFMLSIGGILVLMNVLYFTHLIPPIPLSLRVAGIYHSIERKNATYVAMEESVSVTRRLMYSYPVVHITREPLYFFSAVFAPTTLKTRIVHVWQYYDEDTKTWETKLRSAFAIVGGRDGGYRGYTIKNNVIPGHWRVRVETERGELLGSTTFVVLLATSPVLLTEKKL